VIGADGEPADGAEITISRLGHGPHDVEITQFADGNGFVGATDLPFGAYRLVIRTGGDTVVRSLPRVVIPGRVTRFVVRLDLRHRGPKVRAESLSLRAASGDEQEVSPVECWRGREPIAEDLAGEPGTGRCEDR
jgi:hypothetical protein